MEFGIITMILQRIYVLESMGCNLIAIEIFFGYNK